ncbi:hypothetical protein DSECCO2_537280 [anaerobic digester metagenome]
MAVMAGKVTRHHHPRGVSAPGLSGGHADDRRTTILSSGKTSMRSCRGARETGISRDETSELLPQTPVYFLAVP